MDDALDEALLALDGFAPEFGPGLSNHGPMAAEALVALGRDEDVAPFVDAYRRRLVPGPRPGQPLPADQWEQALGRPDRWADWVALFDRQLADDLPAEVAARWVPRLAPGSIGAATHGLIRTAHALRSLDRAEVDGSPRRHELAQALAYWAVRYQELPGPPLLVGHAGVAAALAGLPVLPEEAAQEGLIADQVRHLDMVAAPFEQAVAALAPPGDLHRALAELAAGGAVAYLANAAEGDAVALVHAVTAPMALDLVLPVVRAEDRQGVFAYAWQAVASIHVAYAPRRPSADVAAAGEVGHSPDPAELVAAAVASGDEHAVKLAEAADRAHRVTGHPALPAAVADAATRLG
ncbi:MAG TPA: questin oxidase family protein [Acidimicrobiales bacterium]|nr:questin oxidase family protein [Acidimicrobiales bacterium]